MKIQNFININELGTAFETLMTVILQSNKIDGWDARNGVMTFPGGIVKLQEVDNAKSFSLQHVVNVPAIPMQLRIRTEYADFRNPVRKSFYLKQNMLIATTVVLTKDIIE
ncbi:hypothetical protein WUBG_08010 [Wuchereria bancrofti]|uniref:Uncharacterized protein n=1 Tax=Wuchereria bancrofti TaxID=6293 RepID=J9EF71_WUCBA|nr:hypothetical protein WUBG_08010 [Wuchereria bancrofti]VDM11605.1 unnamed protein product [Wuchereria bancrofti]